MSFSGSGMASGAAGGAMMGSAAGPWGTAAGAVVGGLIGGFGGKKAKNDMVVTEPKWYSTPGSEGSQKAAWGSIQSGMESLSRGEAPSWFTKAVPTMRRQLTDPTRSLYFGGPGSQGPGMIQRSMEAASISGAGPRGAVNAARKSMADYQTRMGQIDDTIQMLGYNTMQSENSRLQDLITSRSGQFMTPQTTMVSTPGSNPGGALLGMGAANGGFSAGAFGGAGLSSATNLSGSSSMAGPGAYGTTPTGYTGSKTYF